MIVEIDVDSMRRDFGFELETIGGRYPVDNAHLMELRNRRGRHAGAPKGRDGNLEASIALAEGRASNIIAKIVRSALASPAWLSERER